MIEITVREMGDAQVLLAAVQAAYDKGMAIADTPTLLEWARTNRGANRLIDRTWAETHLDPTGLHLAEAVLFHNDVEWRLRISAKLTGQENPRYLWQDVTPEQWNLARTGTKRSLEDLRGKIADAEVQS